jgi:hypothetical protein
VRRGSLIHHFYKSDSLSRNGDKSEAFKLPDRLRGAISDRFSKLKLLPKKWISSPLLLFGVRGVPLGGPRGVARVWGVPESPSGVRVGVSELLESFCRTRGEAEVMPTSSSSCAERVSND